MRCLWKSAWRCGWMRGFRGRPLTEARHPTSLRTRRSRPWRERRLHSAADSPQSCWKWRSSWRPSLSPSAGWLELVGPEIARFLRERVLLPPRSVCVCADPFRVRYPNRIRSSVRSMFVPYHIGRTRKAVPTFFRTNFFGAPPAPLEPPARMHERNRPAEARRRPRGVMRASGSARVSPLAEVSSSASARGTSPCRSTGSRRSSGPARRAARSSAPSRDACAQG